MYDLDLNTKPMLWFLDTEKWVLRDVGVDEYMVDGWAFYLGDVLDY